MEILMGILLLGGREAIASVRGWNELQKQEGEQRRDGSAK